MTKTKKKRTNSGPIKSKLLKVIARCCVCGWDVAATTKDKAYRHGFNRYKTLKSGATNQFSQEDGTPCSGSGQTVLFRRRRKK